MTETFFLLPEKGRHRRPFSLVWLSIAVVLGACQPGLESPATGPFESLVTRVDHIVDGDTLWVDDLDESVRLIGIDTPEVNPEIECYGEEAEQRLIDLIPAGTQVEIKFDEETFDRFGRYLGYVYRVSDGLFINQAMISEGFAEMVRIEPNTRFATQFEAAESLAQDAQLGLWSVCS